MSRKTTFRTSTMILTNNSGVDFTLVEQKIQLPENVDVFRIHLQCQLIYNSWHTVTRTFGAYSMHVMPYLAVNGQSGEEFAGIKLSPILQYREPAASPQLVRPSDILILDRRSTGFALDEIYLTAHELPSLGYPYSSLYANMLFECYI